MKIFNEAQITNKKKNEKEKENEEGLFLILEKKFKFPLLCLNILCLNR